MTNGSFSSQFKTVEPLTTNTNENVTQCAFTYTHIHTYAFTYTYTHIQIDPRADDADVGRDKTHLRPSPPVLTICAV